MILCPGEVVIVDFDPVIGHEQAGTRPAVVISAPRHLTVVGGRMATVCPVSTRDRKLRHHVAVTAGPTHRLGRPSWVMAEQQRTVSSRRIRASLGNLAATDLAELLRSVHRLIAGPPMVVGGRAPDH